MEANRLKSPYKYLLDLCELLETVDVEYRERQSNLNTDFDELHTELYVLVPNTGDGNGLDRKRQKKNHEGNSQKLRRNDISFTSLNTKQSLSIPATSGYNRIRRKRKISIMDYDVIRHNSLRSGSNANTYKMTSVAEAEEIEAVELFFNSMKDNLRAMVDKDNVYKTR